MLQFKVLTEPKTVPFKRYVYILRGNTYYITGTCQWRMHVSDNTEEKYIFLEFTNTVFKAGESKIDSKPSQMF